MPYFVEEDPTYPTWTIPKLSHKTAVIVGGGPSLRDFPFHELKEMGVFCIGVNRSYLLEDFSLCPYTFHGDTDFPHNEGENYAKYKGIFITNDRMGKHIGQTANVVNYSDGGMKEEQDCLGWYQNSGLTTIELAAKMGCSKIILLGFDYKAISQKENNWHTYDPVYDVYPTVPKESVHRQSLKFTIILDKEMKRLFPQVSVLNANPDSACDVWPKVDWRKSCLE